MRRLLRDIPRIHLVKQNGIWVTDKGQKVILRPWTQGVTFKATGHYEFGISEGRRLFTRSHRIVTDGESGNIISIKRVNHLFLSDPQVPELEDVDMFSIGADHPMAGSFYALVDIVHEESLGEPPYQHPTVG